MAPLPTVTCDGSHMPSGSPPGCPSYLPQPDGSVVPLKPSARTCVQPGWLPTGRAVDGAATTGSGAGAAGLGAVVLIAFAIATSRWGASALGLALGLALVASGLGDGLADSSATTEVAAISAAGATGPMMAEDVA